ncbi:hypothetical protein [Marinobacterium sp. BA1]|uniref:hypothetical protein n=1 Tax=Marinobacterium sp. BA1 TaxID=3138931 RepID=UPI0032E6BB80
MKPQLTTFTLLLGALALTGCMEPYAKSQQRAYVPAPTHSIPAPPARPVTTSAPATTKAVTRSAIANEKPVPIASTGSARTVSTASKPATGPHDDGIDVLKPVDTPNIESTPITIHID